MRVLNYLIKIFLKKIYNYNHIHEITLNVFKDRESNLKVILIVIYDQNFTIIIRKHIIY